MSVNDDLNASNRSGCGCIAAISGVLLILVGSLFLLTFVDGVVSSDDRVTDNTGTYLFLLAVTVLPGVHLIRRARRRSRTPATQPRAGGEQPPPSVGTHTEEPGSGVEADEHPNAASPTASFLLITRPLEMGGRPYTVSFDDEPLGKLRPGQTGEWEIPAGLHWVTVKTRRLESNAMIIEPRAGDRMSLECRPAGGDPTDTVGGRIEGILLERVDS